MNHAGTELESHYGAECEPHDGAERDPHDGVMLDTHDGTNLESRPYCRGLQRLASIVQLNQLELNDHGVLLPVNWHGGCLGTAHVG